MQTDLGPSFGNQHEHRDFAISHSSRKTSIASKSPANEEKLNMTHLKAVGLAVAFTTVRPIPLGAWQHDMPLGMTHEEHLANMRKRPR